MATPTVESGREHALRIDVAPIISTTHHVARKTWLPTTAGLASTSESQRSCALAQVPWGRILARQWAHGESVRTGTLLKANLLGQAHEFVVLNVSTAAAAQAHISHITKAHALPIAPSTEVVIRAAQCDPQRVVAGGYTSVVRQTVQLIQSYFHRTSHPLLASFPEVQGCLVQGLPGIGKTTIIYQIINQVGVNAVTLSLLELLRPFAHAAPNSATTTPATVASAVDQHILAAFSRAALAVPCIVVVPDLGLMGQTHAGGHDELRRQVLESLAQQLAVLPSGVFVLGACRRASWLPDAVSKLPVFQKQITLPMPNHQDRRAILMHHLMHRSKSIENIVEWQPSVISRVVARTMGYTGRDLVQLYRQACLCQRRLSLPISSSDVSEDAVAQATKDLRQLTIHLKQPDATASRDCPSWAAWQQALTIVRPSQGIEFETAIPERTWNQLGGYDQLKTRLQLLLRLIEARYHVEPSSEAPGAPVIAHDSRAFLQLGVQPPAGILLYGPSGCGKTAMAQALANEANMNTIFVKGPEVFSKYFGDSEATVRRLFRTARTIAPCIVWIDELDAIARKRGWNTSDESNSVDSRVLSTLLNEMDGVQDRPGVLVVGCTCYPDTIDDAILRPGRLDQLLYVGLPEHDDRLAILAGLAQRHPLAADVELTTLASQTAGFTPARLENLMREAGIIALRQDIQADVIEQRHIDAALAQFGHDPTHEQQLHHLLQRYARFRQAKSV
ncbi:hypothetical protein H4R35_006348 [Dimargaris xerosporica]|nr:hypothetical protein H4R35_006348 [Dimargaris xerosporica]